MTHASLSSQTDFVPRAYDEPHIVRQFDEIIDRVAQVVMPVWPLRDYVAVNPYAGMADRSFLDARAFLRVVSDSETLMPLKHYASQYADGKIVEQQISSALRELKDSSVPMVAEWTTQSIIEKLQGALDDDPATGLLDFNQDRNVRTLAESVDENTGSDWTTCLNDEVGKHMAAHFDQGQASWQSPWQDLPLFQAWRSAASSDYAMDAKGLRGFRKFVHQLPHTPHETIVGCLETLKIPEPLWESYLHCVAFSMPGWAAWARYQDQQSEERQDDSFIGFLAIRLAYEAALCRHTQFSVQWSSFLGNEAAIFQSLASTTEDAALRYVMLRAGEIGYRQSVIDQLSTSEPAASGRKLAQMVFCIDVRSERFRRQLEATSSQVQTFGFAGFFGMPIEYARLGSTEAASQVPALLKPQYRVRETLETDVDAKSQAVESRWRIRTNRKLWKSLQTSALGCFPFVETAGLLYAWRLVTQAIGFGGTAKNESIDGVAERDQDKLTASLDGLAGQGLDLAAQIDLAQSTLTNLGLRKDFARLVVLCGHASVTQNNPLAAGLDCGACCGHSGEPNARFAAKLLNHPEIRSGLSERGIMIPDDTVFLAALHETTTDRVELFNVNELSQTHQADADELRDYLAQATVSTRRERMPSMGSQTHEEVLRKSNDWSEVRPEWGLAGNAAFIVGPRSMTRHADLQGKAFLHSYDQDSDPDGSVLEVIMTAPMVVGSWINLQYYASTVDQTHFGSGNKTIHNVVGQFGILSGNGSDLMTGLPWQSLHDGDSLSHEPMRLQVFIAAPRKRILSIIEKHAGVADLLHNEWLHLTAIDDGVAYRYAVDGTWHSLADKPKPHATARVAETH